MLYANSLLSRSRELQPKSREFAPSPEQEKFLAECGSLDVLQKDITSIPLIIRII
jgi:hypothetical protein